MARRRWQSASVFLRGRRVQKWVGRWREDIVQPDGSRYRMRHSVVLGVKSAKDCPTEKEALRRLQPFLDRVNSADFKPTQVSTVAQFVEWWQSNVLIQHKPSTARAATAHLRCHILPQLGKLRLDAVTLEQQQVFVTRLSQSVSPKSVRNIVGTLSALLRSARKNRYSVALVNLSDLALPDEGVKHEARFFTPVQVRQIIDRAGEPFRTMFCILAATGLRAGELLGLTVDDLDFDHRLIHVRRSVIRGRVQSLKSKASRRPLPMPDALAEILKQHLRGWRETPERWLFVNSRNRPYSADKVVMSKLWPILDTLKITRCGLHAFRHFHASQLLERGAAPQVTQAQMRHSDPRITLGIYAHVIDESQRKAVDRVAEVLDPVGPKMEPSGEWIQ